MCTGVTIDGVWIGWLDLFTIYMHQSEPQAITAIPLISTIYKSQQHSLSLFLPSLFTSHVLATDV
jgi:hypothetical protein